MNYTFRFPSKVNLLTFFDYIIVCIILFLYFLNSASAAQIESLNLQNSNTKIIQISGELLEGDDLKFSKIAAEIPNAKVLLNSSGGLLIVGLEIGKIIKIRGYDTSVEKDATCASACALIWLAGNKKEVDQTGKIGFHASYKDNKGKLIEVGVANALIGHYISQLGYSEKTVIFATTASPTELLWLDRNSEKDSGINYEIINKSSSSSSNLFAKNKEIKKSDSNDPFEQEFFIDNSPEVIRNVDRFLDGLRKASFNAEVDKRNSDSPKIYVGVSGHKIMISFSSCTNMDCDYIELIALWTGVKSKAANKIVRDYALSENYASIYYDKDRENLAVYHYIILGKDGITIQNLIENLQYLTKDFEKIGNLAASVK